MTNLDRYYIIGDIYHVIKPEGKANFFAQNYNRMKKNKGKKIPKISTFKSD